MPPANGSSTRGGSTSVRGRVRSPHISGGRPAAGSQRADSLGSFATQQACYSVGWDRQTDGQMDGSQYGLMPHYGSRVVSVLDSGAEGLGSNRSRDVVGQQS